MEYLVQSLVLDHHPYKWNRFSEEICPPGKAIAT
jgi:hypothetical protein